MAEERETGQSDKMEVQETAKGRCEWHGSMKGCEMCIEWVRWKQGEV